MKNLLNTFRPLCHRPFGKEAIRNFGLKPFVDGSIRREPDFESPFPSITAICRGARCAPRLNERDRIVYMTTKVIYPPLENDANRVVAFLEVVKRCESHEAAAAWYRNEGFPLPSNCLVEGNPPLPLERSAGFEPAVFKRIGKAKPERRQILTDHTYQEWDQEYLEKVRNWPVFIITKPLFLELKNPPPVYEKELKQIFGRVPGTRTPPWIADEEFDALLDLCKKKQLTAAGV